MASPLTCLTLWITLTLHLTTEPTFSKVLSFMSSIELPPDKTKGHLTLLRPSRSLTPKEFNALTFEERLRIIRNASGRQKYDLVIEAADARELVRRLPSQEVYLLIKELGVEDCLDLLTMATTEQLTTFFDLDFWQGQELMTKPALEWLMMLLETGEENTLRIADELDFELLTVMMQKFVTITRGIESLTDEDALAEGRLERIYDMDFLDSESAKVVGYFLDILFRHDRDFYIQLLESVRNQIPTEIENLAFSSRSARLQDRGFPDPFEALEVFGYLPPASFAAQAPRKVPFRPGEEDADAPGFFLAVPAGDLLGEVLAHGLEPDTCWELTYLLNKVMIADRADVGEMEQVAGEMNEVYRYLNIALEYLSGGRFEEAVRSFDHYYLEYLFRLGVSLTLDLQRRAEKIRRNPAFVFLDGPFRALVDALGRRRPRFYEGIGASNRAGERPFATLGEVRQAEQWLARVETQLQLFDGALGFALPDPNAMDLGGCVPDQARDLALSDLFLTALGNRVLGREFRPTPIPAAELLSLWQALGAGGRVKDALREETIAWSESLVPGSGDFAGYCLDLLQEGFCALDAAELDPRFIGGLIVRVEKT